MKMGEKKRKKGKGGDAKGRKRDRETKDIEKRRGGKIMKSKNEE